MKTMHDRIVTIAFAVAIALQAWTLKEVVTLKVQVAKLESRLDSAYVSQPGKSQSDHASRLTHHAVPTP